MKKYLFSLHILVYLFLGCQKVSSIEVQPMEIEFQSIGQSLKLEIKALDQHGVEIKEPELVIKSRDPSVAEITPDRTVIARGAGTTTIEIRSGDAMEFVHVKVRLPDRLIIKPNSFRLNLAGVKKLKPKLVDKMAEEIKGVKFEFRSSDPSGLKVDPDGTVTALKEGNYEITITALEKKAVVKVEVPPYIPPWEKGKKKRRKRRVIKKSEQEEREYYEDPRLQIFDKLIKDNKGG